MKRAIWIALLLLSALCASACANEEIYRTITPEEVVDRIAEGDGVLLDVRTVTEFDEKHIPGALLLPLDEIAEVRPEALADVQEAIYVYCRSGRRSRDAANRLIALGYENVYDLGGILDWPYETVSTQDEAAAAQARGETS